MNNSRFLVVDLEVITDLNPGLMMVMIFDKLDALWLLMYLQDKRSIIISPKNNQFTITLMYFGLSLENKIMDSLENILQKTVPNLPANPNSYICRWRIQ